MSSGEPPNPNGHRPFSPATSSEVSPRRETDQTLRLQVGTDPRFWVRKTPVWKLHSLETSWNKTSMLYAVQTLPGVSLSSYLRVYGAQSFLFFAQVMSHFSRVRTKGLGTSD